MGRERYTAEQRDFYRSYINSMSWKIKRKRRLHQAGNRCEWISTTARGEALGRCPRRNMLTVHHNTYERLGNELDADLNVLCWFHHMTVHLLWIECLKCKQPWLESDYAAEHWLLSELRSLRINLDGTAVVNWKTLPSKDDLVIALSAERPCEFCLRK